MRKSFQRNKSKLAHEENRKKRNMMLMSLFLMFILVSSLFGYAFFYNTGSAPQTSVEEYGTNFRIANIEGQQVWQAKFDGEERTFLTRPTQVEGYYSTSEAIDAYLAAESIAITFDPVKLDPQTVPLFLTQFYDVAQDKPVTYGVLEETTFYPNVTQITCADSTPQNVVVLIGLTNQTNQTGILLKDNCLTVQGYTPQDLFYMTEKLRFSYFGIDFDQPIN